MTERDKLIAQAEAFKELAAELSKVRAIAEVPAEREAYERHYVWLKVTNGLLETMAAKERELRALAKQGD